MQPVPLDPSQALSLARGRKANMTGWSVPRCTWTSHALCWEAHGGRRTLGGIDSGCVKSPFHDGWILIHRGDHILSELSRLYCSTQKSGALRAQLKVEDKHCAFALRWKLATGKAIDRSTLRCLWKCLVSIFLFLILSAVSNF